MHRLAVFCQCTPKTQYGSTPSLNAISIFHARAGMPHTSLSGLTNQRKVDMPQDLRVFSDDFQQKRTIRSYVRLRELERVSVEGAGVRDELAVHLQSDVRECEGGRAFENCAQGHGLVLANARVRVKERVAVLLDRSEHYFP